MGSEMTEDKISLIDLAKDPRSVQPGTEQWAKACREIREACEEMGSFRVVYHGIPTELRLSMFEAMTDLFNLPPETKQKNASIKPYFGYVGGRVEVPLYESLGVEGATELDNARAFSELMWPAGNGQFCKTLHSMSKKMMELELILTRMIFDSFGVVKCLDGYVENRNSVFRVMKYNAPANNGTEVGLVAHTDKNMLTILCQDEVQGLQVLSKNGEWCNVDCSGSTFAVLIGDSFKVWSNGRFPAAKHRVVMKGVKERYSCGIFSLPKEGYIIEIPPALVDKDHPLLYKPFNFMEFLSYCYSNQNNQIISDNVVENYAGI